MLTNPGAVRITAGDNVRVFKNCTLIGKIDLRDNVEIRENSILEGEITIGRHSRIAYGNELVGTIRIGRYCAIARETTFKDRDHFIHYPSMQCLLYRNIFNMRLKRVSKGPIVLGNDVWVGKRTIVLSGVTIGDGAVVGAGSVVTKDVEPYSIVAGAPAKQRKWRFPENVRDQLQEIAWWDWDHDRIGRNRTFFTTDLQKVEDLNGLIVD